MNIDTILQHCDDIDRATAAIRAELNTAPPPATRVNDSAALAAALDSGGPIALAAGVTFSAAGGFAITVPATTVVGEGGNVVTATSAPALRVVPGVHDTRIECVDLRTAWTGTPLQIGRNDSEQVTVEDAPDGVIGRVVTSSGHRGKRAIEVNGRTVELHDCEVHDCYDPGGRDSQAVWIGNAPGPVSVVGGYFEGASETLMVGGDRMKIPDCRPTGIVIRGGVYTKPLAWKAAGIPVKNLIECKDGLEVLIEECDLSNCWKSGQDGYAFMFTPANGGAVQAVVRNCRVENVGGIVNVTGTDASGINPTRTDVAIYGGEYRTNRAAMGGSGRFMLAQRGPASLIVVGALIAHEGNALADLADDDVPIDVLRLVGATWNYGAYGIRIGGASHGDNAAGIIEHVTITGNTISGAHSAFRSRYPDNTYVANMSNEREREVDGVAARYAYALEVRDELHRMRAWEQEYRL
jgi:hypothetical protein